MDKKYVDKIIAEYIKKIFGYALSKTMNIDKAEELASRVTFDVYVSLLKTDTVKNIDGYIYRVFRNVYARFVDEEIKGRYICLDEARLPDDYDFLAELEKDETYIRLRSEVSYLGKIQREIIVMHYFQKIKQNKIAQTLNIPLGTVKWHLHEARNQLKEGINKMREKVTLGMKPIKFDGMGHSGRPGNNGEDTAYYLSKLISQNIAYSAYHSDKTITEIAEELGVPATFIEDEVTHLEENGFMDKVSGGKYLTNIFITESSNEIFEKEHLIYTKYAKIVCDKYVPLVFNVMKNYKKNNIYSPQDDFNFLMWSAVTYACGYKLRFSSDNIDLSQYNVKRKDGGEYIAFASVESNEKQEKFSFNNMLYQSCGDMTRCSDSFEGEPYPVEAWQLDTFYDNRKDSWKNNLNNDYRYLYEYLTGEIKKDHINVEKFKRLYDKGYIVSQNDKEYVNIIVTSLSQKDFNDLLPSISDELKKISEECDAEIFRITKNQYPPHMQNLLRARTTDCFSNNSVRTRVLEQLVAANILKPLTENQKHSVNTIMFCDILPK